MPNKTPQFWADLLNWFNSNSLAISGAILSFLVSTLMRLRDGDTKRSAIIDGCICGFLTLGMVSLISHFGKSSDLVIFAGGFIGFIGVKKISELIDSLIIIILKFLGRKYDSQ